MSDEKNRAELPGIPPLEGLILTSKNEPFKDVSAASRKRVELMTANAGEQYSVVSVLGGFALLKTIKTPAELRAEADIAERLSVGNSSLDDGESEYVKVVFDAKTDTQEPNDVMLGLNGEHLVMQREVEVVIPRAYLEVADQTLRQKFRQLPGQTRKTIAHVKTFTYRVTGSATKDDFERMKREGTQVMKDSVME